LICCPRGCNHWSTHGGKAWADGDGTTASRKRKRDENDDDDALGCEQAEADAKGVLELRKRVRMHANNVGVAAVDDAAGFDLFEAALDFSDAVDAADNLPDIISLCAAVQTALRTARRAVNVERTAATAAAGYRTAAAYMLRCDADEQQYATRRRFEAAVAIGAAAPPSVSSATATSAADALAPAIATLTEAASKLAQARPLKAKGKAGAKGRKERKPCTGEGERGWYEVKPGGNEKCPYACKEPHGKGAPCHYHHKDK
jgi:hypothetical protein